MKPRTQLHREVAELSAKLPKISAGHKSWAYNNLFKRLAYKTKHLAVCFECNHKWSEETNLSSSLLGITCPKCGTELKVAENKKHRQRQRQYFYITDVVGGMQVFRYFHVDKWCELERKPQYSCDEIYQHWITPEGKVSVMAIKVNAMGSFYSEHSQWVWGSDMEIRNQHDRYYLNDVKRYPRGNKILPIIKRNGYTGTFYGFNPPYFCEVILTNPMAETLLKVKQYSLFSAVYRRGEEIRQYWSSIRICIRNNYIIKDAGTWLDHLDLLEYFKKDTLNAKYVCPANITEEHKVLIARKRAIEIKERELADAKRLPREKANERKQAIMFRKLKEKYFNLRFEGNGFEIVILKSKAEFNTEGIMMKNCVDSKSKYFTNKNTLIMSARTKEERLATIEFSLSDMKVVQCSAYDNKTSKYEKRIKALIDKNLKTIWNIKVA